jgi:hypothetical protein
MDFDFMGFPWVVFVDMSSKRFKERRNAPDALFKSPRRLGVMDTKFDFFRRANFLGILLPAERQNHGSQWPESRMRERACRTPDERSG